MAVSQPKARCRECQADVPTDASVCPTCGYDGTAHGRSRVTLGFIGTALTVSVVFAPVGLPMVWGAYRRQRSAGGTVTKSAGTSLVAHLTAVCRQYLGLSLGIDHGGEFIRGESSKREP